MRSILVILCLVLAGCTAPAPGDLGDDRSFGTGHPLEGTPAPAYAPSAISGDERTLQDRNGTVTLVFVWASWCTVCKADEPYLVEMFEDVQEAGFDVMAVSHETSQSEATQFAANQDWPFSAYWDPGVNDHFGVRDYQPNYMLIGQDGTIQWVKTQGLGPSGMDDLQQVIESLQGTQP